METTIRLLGLDIDGTLVNSRKELTAATIEALQQAAEQGVTVALATGRMLSECRELLLQLPMLTYAVTCTGAETVDLRTGRVLATHSLTPEEVRQVSSRVMDLDVMLQIFDSRDGAIHNSRQCIDQAERFCGEELARMFRVCHVAEEDFPGYIRDFSVPSAKVHMFFASRADKETAWERMADLPLMCTESQWNDLELMAAGVDKGTGLQDLANHLGLTADQVMAIGDNGNDLGMLRWAGRPVAMGNGTPEVRAVAREVTADNDHDGVAKAVRRMLEGD